MIRTAVLTRAAACLSKLQAVSVRALLPKVAESARLALAGAAAVLVLSTAAVQPALANSCGSMPTGAWVATARFALPKPICADARRLPRERAQLA